MQTSARRLADLIVSLLDYGAIESGRLDVRIEAVDPQALAEQLQQELEPQARLKGLDLRFSVAKDLPPIETDRRLLRLVLVNLVENAIKFTDQGTVLVSLTCGKDAHSFDVRDTGPGIPAEDQLRVFDPFEQLELIRQHHPGVGVLRRARQDPLSACSHVALSSPRPRRSRRTLRSSRRRS
jgi:two-component system, sensor histidine kinase and response regulator